jgi:hypothetical protein
VVALRGLVVPFFLARCQWRKFGAIFPSAVPSQKIWCHFPRRGAILFGAVPFSVAGCHFFRRDAITKNLGHQIGVRGLAQNLCYSGCCEPNRKRRKNRSGAGDGFLAPQPLRNARDGLPSNQLTACANEPSLPRAASVLSFAQTHLRLRDQRKPLQRAPASIADNIP